MCFFLARVIVIGTRDYLKSLYQVSNKNVCHCISDRYVPSYFRTLD